MKIRSRAGLLVAAAFAASCGGSTDAGGGTSYACTQSDADDGSSAAATLGAASLDCQYRSTRSTWANAMSYCAGLGSGWRLPSKGEALKIASSPNVCRTALPATWYTWTRTCAGAGLAWGVNGNGLAYQGGVDNGYFYALCVR